MPKRVLVIEDTPIKWTDIKSVLDPLLTNGDEVIHVADMVSARQRLFRESWTLLVLDVSLDINPNGNRQRGAQQFTGGLTLASRMHFLRRTFPTIIVTGFETFVSSRPQSGQDVVLGLQDVEREMRKYLGDDVLGLVRHRSEGWRDNLNKLARQVLQP